MDPVNLLTIGGLAVGSMAIIALSILLRRGIVAPPRFPLLLGIGGFVYAATIFAIGIMIIPDLSRSFFEILWAIPIGAAAYIAGVILARGADHE